MRRRRQLSRWRTLTDTDAAGTAVEGKMDVVVVGDDAVALAAAAEIYLLGAYAAAAVGTMTMVDDVE